METTYLAVSDYFMWLFGQPHLFAFYQGLPACFLAVHARIFRVFLKFVNDEFSPRRSEVREDLNAFSRRSSQLRGSILRV